MVPTDRITCTKIAALTGDEIRSVRRVLRGEKVRASTRARVLEAAATLGFAVRPGDATPPAPEAK